MGLSVASANQGKLKKRMAKRKLQKPGKQNPSKERSGTASTGIGFSRLRKLFDPSRSGAVLLTALLVGIYITVRLIAAPDDQHAQLRFVENSNTETSDLESESQVSYREPLSGTAYETALRLREAGALGMAVSLSVFATQSAVGRPPQTPIEAMRNVAHRNLLPPGIELSDGSFRSGVSDFRFSFRDEPLSFEILALPNDRGSGPALLLRFPLPPSEANSVMYFESANSLQLPAPFSTNEQITAAGWRIRHWRGDALPLNEAVMRDLREQDDLLKSLNQDR
jgi:hypothetical protein